MSLLEKPIMKSPGLLAGDWQLLPSFMPVPGMGVLAVNSFVLPGPEPLLIDSGLAALGRDWLAALEQLVDPAALRWIWVSHADADHVGNLAVLLERAPRAKVLTDFLGMGKLLMLGFDPSRMQMIEAGQSLKIAGRSLIPVRPPYFDAPETLGFFDTDASVLFTVDCFGAVLPEPVSRAEDVDMQKVAEAMVQWSAIDAPWLARVDASKLKATMDSFARLSPETIFSSHLPPCGGGMDELAPIITQAWCGSRRAGADPFDIEALISNQPGLLRSQFN
jgi:flavorubredoxin